MARSNLWKDNSNSTRSITSEHVKPITDFHRRSIVANAKEHQAKFNTSVYRCSICWYHPHIPSDIEGTSWGIVERALSRFRRTLYSLIPFLSASLSQISLTYSRLDEKYWACMKIIKPVFKAKINNFIFFKWKSLLLGD